jgi:hypothetical protein
MERLEAESNLGACRPGRAHVHAWSGARLHARARGAEVKDLPRGSTAVAEAKAGGPEQRSALARVHALESGDRRRRASSRSKAAVIPTAAIGEEAPARSNLFHWRSATELSIAASRFAWNDGHPGAFQSGPSAARGATLGAPMQREHKIGLGRRARALIGLIASARSCGPRCRSGVSGGIVETAQPRIRTGLAEDLTVRIPDACRGDSARFREVAWACLAVRRVVAHGGT